MRVRGGCRILNHFQAGFFCGDVALNRDIGLYDSAFFRRAQRNVNSILAGIHIAFDRDVCRPAVVCNTDAGFFGCYIAVAFLVSLDFYGHVAASGGLSNNSRFVCVHIAFHFNGCGAAVGSRCFNTKIRVNIAFHNDGCFAFFPIRGCLDACIVGNNITRYVHGCDAAVFCGGINTRSLSNNITSNSGVYLSFIFRLCLYTCRVFTGCSNISANSDIRAAAVGFGIFSPKICSEPAGRCCHTDCRNGCVIVLVFKRVCGNVPFHRNSRFCIVRFIVS